MKHPSKLIFVLLLSFFSALHATAYIEEHAFDVATAKWFGKAHAAKGDDGILAGTWETPAGIREIFGINLGKNDPPSTSFDTISFDYQISTPRAWFGLRITDHPLADGFDAIWTLRNIPDTSWHSCTADVNAPDNVWGEKPTLNRRTLCWRVHSTPEQPTTVRVRNIVYRRFKLFLKPLSAQIKWLSSDTFELPVTLLNRLDSTFTGTLSLDSATVSLLSPVSITIGSHETRDFPLRFSVKTPLPKAFTPLSFTVRLLDKNSELASFADIRTLMSFPFTDGPSLLFTNQSLTTIRHRLQQDTTLGTWWRERFLPLVDSYLPQPVEPPTRGSQWPCHYICSKCGAGLKEQSPTRHVCSKCGAVHSGWPYDDCPLYGQHRAYSEKALYLGIAYAVTQNQVYADKAREILLRYADIYPSFTLHGNNGKPVNGGGFAFSEALHEAIWHIQLTQAFDCIRNLLTTEQQNHIARNLLLRFANYVRTVNHGIHNHECWHQAAAGVVGFALNNPLFVRDAIYGYNGLLEQIQKGTTDDGPWFEGTWNYHFFTLQALEPLTLAALNHGIDVRTQRYRSMYDAPFQQLTPTYELPAFHDSHRVSFTPEKYGKTYETAATWWPSPLFNWWLQQGQRRNLSAILHGSPLKDNASPSFSSALYPAAGYAILRTRSPDRPHRLIPHNYLALDFGEHGGWHGHADKLNLVIWLRGTMFAEDSGTTSYANPRDKEWYKATISHNTVMLDGVSQNAATGHTLAFATANNAAIVSCDAGEVYKDAVLQRHVALIDDTVLDVFTVRSSRPRDITWFFHARHESTELPGVSCPPPPLAGAKWGEDWHQSTHNGHWNDSWTQNEQTLSLTQSSLPGTLFACHGLTVPHNARTSLRANCIHADKAIFATILSAAHKGLPAKLEIDEATMQDNGACTLHAVVNGRSWLLLFNPQGNCSYGHFNVSAKAALLEKGTTTPRLILTAP